jgi:single-strand DNA-binding protein
MNRVIITGNLGQAPEVRKANSGLPIANLRIATNERVKDGDEWKDHTEWHSVVVFGKQAENCEQYLDKGSKVAVEGKIRTRQWEDKEGNQRRSTEIVADRVEFMTRPENSNSRPSAPQSQSTYVSDDSVPF